MCLVIAHEIFHTLQEPIPSNNSAPKRKAELAAERFSVFIVDRMAKQEGERLLDHLPPGFTKHAVWQEIKNDFEVWRKSDPHQTKNMRNLIHRMAGGKELPPYWWDALVNTVGNGLDAFGLRNYAESARSLAVAKPVVDPKDSPPKR